VVVIMFGINDAAVDVWKTPSATESRVSLANYRQNLTAMIRTLKGQGLRVVLMTSNPVHGNDKTKIMYGHPPHDPDAVRWV
jgi:lysophospholipase L1-like esterase